VTAAGRRRRGGPVRASSPRREAGATPAGCATRRAGGSGRRRRRPRPRRGRCAARGAPRRPRSLRRRRRQTPAARRAARRVGGLRPTTAIAWLPGRTCARARALDAHRHRAGHRGGVEAVEQRVGDHDLARLAGDVEHQPRLDQQRRVVDDLVEHGDVETVLFAGDALVLLAVDVDVVAVAPRELHVATAHAQVQQRRARGQRDLLGLRVPRAPPNTMCSPAPRSTVGPAAPSTTAGRPSTVTSWGRRSALSGRRTRAGVSVVNRCSQLPPGASTFRLHEPRAPARRRPQRVHHRGAAGVLHRRQR